VGQVQTSEANSPNIRERFRMIGSIVSECFYSSWAAEPIGQMHGPSSVSWAYTDGISVSRAQMTPQRMINSCATSRHKRRYYAYSANQTTQIRLPGQPIIHVQPDEVMILSSSTPSEWFMSRPYETSCLIIEEDLFHQYVLNADEIVGRRLDVPDCLRESLKGIVDSAWAISAAGLLDVAGLKLARSFMEMLSVASLSPSTKNSDEVRSTRCALDVRRMQVKAYVKDHYRDPDLSVNTIARSLNLSPRYVQLAFAPEQTTPSEFIRELRLEASARMLGDLRNSRSITEVLYECGFNSSSHFSTQFKNHFGISPRDFRMNAHAQREFQ
jgi:AraC-like DNA-binding protein